MQPFSTWVLGRDVALLARLGREPHHRVGPARQASAVRPHMLDVVEPERLLAAVLIRESPRTSRGAGLRDVLDVERS